MPAFTEETIAEALRRRTEAAQTRIVEVRVSEGEDSEGEPAYFVELVLPNPPDDRGTWPVDDIWALRRWVRDAIADATESADVRWFVAFEPQDDDELEPDDAADRIAAG